MPLIIQNIRLPLDEPETRLPELAAAKLHLPAEAVRSCRPLRRSLDARKKDDIHFVYHVQITLEGGHRAEQHQLRRRHRDVTQAKTQSPDEPDSGHAPLKHRPIIIGFGPAGMFAALTLARRGYQPVVYERGRDVRRRHVDVLKHFYREHVFNPASNLLFGEGGAGTYSDGKIYTRVHDPLVHSILEVFAQHGADPDILIDAKPHIGSDVLPTICRRIRLEIEQLGGTIHFDHCITDVRIEDGRLTALRLNEGGQPLHNWIDTGPVILAIGHSARDTLHLLAQRGVGLQAKPFQLGVRIEHPQPMINRWQFGALCTHHRLPPADYFLVARKAAAEQGDLFSFCMCPGGLILPSNESAGQVATNGASLSRRSGPFGNSGLVITVSPEMFGNDPLQGVAFQEHWERTAFALTGGSYRVPAQRASDFLQGRPSDGRLETSYPLGAAWSDIRAIIPDFVAQALQRGLPMLEKKMPGFAGDDAIVTGPETRASSPVRVPRDNQTRQSTTTSDLFPVGEGAGYAGGIVSSAIDGIKSAHKIIELYKPLQH